MKLKYSFCSAQNDANFRKEKIQSLKCRGEKQTGAGAKQNRSVDRHISSGTSLLVQSSQNSQHSEQTTRIDRLLKEIEALKEANKSLAEQVQVSRFSLAYFFEATNLITSFF